MRYALAVSALLAACAPSKVDFSLVGTWEIMVPNADGVARWVWEIRSNGTYAFHAEGPGNVPAHSGIFAAHNGQYTLESTTLAWADTGTYVEPHNDTLMATGKLGTGAWHRVILGAGAPPTPPAAGGTPPVADVQPPAPPASAPDTEPTPHGKPAIFDPSEIYSFLQKHTPAESNFPDNGVTITAFTILPAGNPGEIGATRTTVREGAHPDDMLEMHVFRDRAATEAAYQTLTDFEGKGFPQRSGEFVASAEFTFHEHGISKCLSRYMVGGADPARVSCYLLITDPNEEAVMVVGTTSERPAPGSNQASQAGFSHADDLILTGLKFWEPVRLGVSIMGILHHKDTGSH